jgi:signal transduction histidine kinase/FixJ family two-component response regulator/HPt (histidine-containing phosphotransfer) domain-containing protein
MSGDSIFASFFATQGYAFFEYLGEGRFRPIGSWPGWCEELWGAAPAANDSLRLGDSSPFLENFLVDAEEFWNSKSQNSLNSGNWIETDSKGNTMPLEAAAYSVDSKRILLLKNLSGAFAEQQAWFQTARDSLLAHEKLHKEIQKKEVLLHCIVHDLTQPLSAMTGVFNLLERETLPSGLKKYVKDGERESKRQELMIRGILEAFSGDLAAQQNQEAATREPSDLLACARQAVEEFSTAFQQRSIRLRIDPSTATNVDWHVVGDAARIDRIFGNLLENAMRYAPAETTVTIGLQAQESFVLAYVDDQGPGLPQDQSQDRLFALFSKGKEHAGKAGLGLYFCKITVERWGGSIGAETRVEGGSRFWFRLPRAAHKGRSEQAATAIAESARSTSSPRKLKPEKSLRVLVADDAEVNRELVTELLRKRGHRAESVADGRQVLEALDRGHFDVLLLDEEMPHMTGLDVTRAIRQRESATGKHQIIIGLSGHATEEDEHHFRDAGMDDCLAKPVHMDALYQTVERSRSESKNSQAQQPPRTEQFVSAPSGTQPASAAPSSPAGTYSNSTDVVAHLRRTTAGNEKLMRSLAKTFLTDAPKTLAQIRRAVEKKDAATLAKASHLLKGSVAIFGASGAVQASRELEALGRSGSLKEASVALGVLEAEFAVVRNQLKAIQSIPDGKTKTKAIRRAKSSRSRGH